MVVDSWDLVDTKMICIDHALTTTAISATPPTVTPYTVNTAQIASKSFIKYVSIVLLHNSQIGNLYDNLRTQATRFNVFMLSSIEITATNSVIPDSISAKCEILSSAML